MFVTVLLCLAHTMCFELICVAAMVVYLVYQNRQLHKALEFMNAKMQWMETRPAMWIETCHEAYLRELWNSRHHLYPVIHPRDDSCSHENDTAAPPRSSTQATQSSSTKRQSSAPRGSSTKKRRKEAPHIGARHRKKQHRKAPPIGARHHNEAPPKKGKHHAEGKKNRKQAKKALTAKVMSQGWSSATWNEQSTQTTKDCGRGLRFLRTRRGIHTARG